MLSDAINRNAMNDIRKPRLRWYQFTLRSLFIVMFLACIGMSWVSIKMQQARKQKEAVEWINRLGGNAFYDNGAFGQAPPPSPKWLRILLGDDFFTNVDGVSLSHTQVTDAGLEHLNGLKQLQTLWLDHTQVTHAGLEHLKGLKQLQELLLGSTPVTDAGLGCSHGMMLRGECVATILVYVSPELLPAAGCESQGPY